MESRHPRGNEILHRPTLPDGYTKEARHPVLMVHRSHAGHAILFEDYDQEPFSGHPFVLPRE